MEYIKSADQTLQLYKLQTKNLSTSLIPLLPFSNLAKKLFQIVFCRKLFFPEPVLSPESKDFSIDVWMDKGLEQNKSHNDFRHPVCNQWP